MHHTALTTWLHTIPPDAQRECRDRLFDLAAHVRAKSVRILCGAGMSKASGFALGRELATRMAGGLLGVLPQVPVPKEIKELASPYPVEAIAEAYSSYVDDATWRRLFVSQFGQANKGPHAGHDALVFLLNNGFMDRVYTTNYDTLIEEKIGTRHITIEDRNIDDLVNPDYEGRIPVLHLHGSLATNCMLRESETYNLDTPLSYVLRGDMTTHWFLWVGYSLGDHDLRSVYLSMRDMLRKHRGRKNPYAVMPLHSDNDEDKLREWKLADKIWTARGVMMLPGVAEMFLPALVAAVRDYEAHIVAARIIEKRGGDPTSTEQAEALWQEAAGLVEKLNAGDVAGAVLAIAELEEAT